MQEFLNQVRQKANKEEYGVVNDYDQAIAFDLARLQEIEDKRKINIQYPDNCIDVCDMNHIIIKNS